MDTIYCTIIGKEPNSMLKILLKLFFFAILAVVKIIFGMDWALLVAAVIVVSDLDEIAGLLGRKKKK